MSNLCERIKGSAGPLCGMLSSMTLKAKAIKIYNLAKELQDDIEREKLDD